MMRAEAALCGFNADAPYAPGNRGLWLKLTKTR
jgi:hypothetical protein